MNQLTPSNPINIQESCADARSVGPTVSVVTRTYGFSADLVAVANALTFQSQRPDEVILLYSEMDKEQLARVCGELGGIRCHPVFIDPATYSSPGSLNIGCSNACGSVVVILNADAIPAHDDFIRELTAPITSGECAATFARQLPKVDAWPIVQAEYLRAFPPSGTARHVLFSNVASAFSRSVWAERRFDEGSVIAEDIAWAEQLSSEGLLVQYVPAARVFHSHNYTKEQRYKRFLLEGKSLKYIYGPPTACQSWFLHFVKRVLVDCVDLFRLGFPFSIFRSIPERWVETRALYKGLRS